MTSDKRAALTAQVTELRRLQLEAIKEATFGGWTHESEAAYETRRIRINALCHELRMLDPE